MWTTGLFRPTARTGDEQSDNCFLSVALRLPFLLDSHLFSRITLFSILKALPVFTAEIALPALLVAVASYLVGSVSAAILVCRAMGLEDPRTSGSGNPGATNVLRVGGKVPAAITLVGDGVKGFLPVLMTSLVTSHPPTVALAAIAAFMGHLYPVFFRFQGGKGVATALGALLGLDLSVGALALLTWLAVSLTFRRSSLSALVTFVLVPVYLLFEGQQAFALAFLVIAGFLFYTHRSNISRLLNGTEPAIGKR